MIWLLKDFDFLSVLLRAATLSLEAFTLGGLFFLFFAALPSKATTEQLGRIRTITARFALALGCAQAVSVLLSTAILIGGAGFSLRSLWTASYFLAGTLEIAACCLLSLLVGRPRGYAALLPAGLLLACSLAQSHAASRIDDRGVLLFFTALHHLGTAGWVGAMLFLLFALRRSPTFTNAQALSRRYSAMALVSVPMLVIAGVGMSWFYVGSWAGVYGTTYGVMVVAKTMLLILMLVLGAGNWQLLRTPQLLSVSGGSAAVLPQLAAVPVRTPRRPFLLRLRRFAEAEIGFGITAILAAASLTSQPPAIDLQQDRLSAHQIIERLRPEAPRLTSPPVALLTPPGTLRDSVEAGVYGAGAVSDVNDRAWSEYNHHWAGLIVLAAGLLAFAARALPAGRLRAGAENWPLLFIGLAVFILLRADPENWPLGPHSFWGSFAWPDVLQHRLYAASIALFAVFEWAVATGRWRGSARAAYVFPLLCAAGGAALLTHSHGLSNVKDEMLAELAHTPIALLGAAAGWGRWLQLRLPGTRAAKTAGLLWPLCLALVGVVLLDYRES